jgi:4-diphosphocytidyl-2-C-methyl-D-erythritol kinase
MMVIFPRAKINIGLRITRKRDDGYHDLQTIFYPVQLCDALEFVLPAGNPRSDSFVSTGFGVGCDPGNNLVMKALQHIRRIKHIPFLSVHLHKNIPSGAGLGGGSSDAAFFLKALNRYFELDLTGEQLKETALSVGSDCPFFIDCLPAYAEGRGEKLTCVRQLPEGLNIVLLNPGININTREAYSRCSPYMDNSDLAALFESDISLWKDKIVNDFEATVFPDYPLIGKIKESLYDAGAIYSSMSGSGSTVYGIFGNTPVLDPGLKKMVIWAGSL